MSERPIDTLGMIRQAISERVLNASTEEIDELSDMIVKLVLIASSPEFRPTEAETLVLEFVKRSSREYRRLLR